MSDTIYDYGFCQSSVPIPEEQLRDIKKWYDQAQKFGKSFQCLVEQKKQIENNILDIFNKLTNDNDRQIFVKYCDNRINITLEEDSRIQDILEKYGYTDKDVTDPEKYVWYKTFTDLFNNISNIKKIKSGETKE